MAAGIAAAGDRPVIFDEKNYAGPEALAAKVAVFYGLEGNLPRVFNDFAKLGRAVYVDLGYWGRREGGRWSGYHKISVNARHPVGYYRKPDHPNDRLQHFGIVPAKWRRTGGEFILLAGMGDKGAYAEGFEPEQWERWAIAEIQRYTKRRILYRAKPSWKTAKPIAGTVWSDPKVSVDAELARAWAVVTHHSNVAVDAILAGVPAFCWGGVAREMSLQDLSRIEDPWFPGGRKQWAADIAYTQWSVEEMRTGLPWVHLKREKII